MKYLFNVGDKVDNFTLLEHIRIETAAGNKEWRWKCIDETGMFYYMRPRALHLKAQKAQKAIDRIVNSDYYEQMGLNQMGLRKKVFSEYISNAARRGIPMNLKFEEFNHLINQDCYYCGSHPYVHKSLIPRANKAEPMLKHNGVDRLDSSIGYEKFNCVPCCFKCNRAKDTMSSEEFSYYIERIHNHIFSEGSTTIPKGSTLEMYAGGKGASPHLIE